MNSRLSYMGKLSFSGFMLAASASSQCAFWGFEPAFAVSSPSSGQPRGQYLGGDTGPRARVKSSSQIKVIERTDGGAADKKKPLSQKEKREARGSGGVTRSEVEVLGTELELSKALDQEISYMEKLLPKMPKKSEQRAEILRRLVENYHQKSILVSFEENRRYIAAWGKWDQAGRRGVEPVLSNNGSRAWVAKVIQRAQQMITDYPTHKRIDEAYFQIGYAMDSVGQRKQAASYYSLLVARFPNSRRIAEAHYALGEFYFDQLDYRKALVSFAEVTRFQKSSYYPMAIYKSAWCHYNLQSYPKSLQAFQQVVSMSSSGGYPQALRLRLREQALREMIPVWAEIGNIAAAEQYYAQVGGDKYYGDMLLKLSQTLRERGQYAESVRVLKIYVAKRPYDFKAAETQINIVDTASLQQDKALAWQEMKVLLSNYRKETPWYQKNASEPRMKEVLDRIEKVSLHLPQKLHAEAQKENNSRYKFQQAEIGYGLFLTFMPESSHAHSVRFSLGEIQYQTARYADSVKTFEPLIKAGARTPYYQKAAEYVLSAAYIPIEKDMSAIRKRPVKTAQPELAIPPPMLTYVRSCDQHLQLFPQDKKVMLQCRLDSAEIYLRHNHYAEAEKRLMVLVQAYPNESYGKNAAEMLLLLSGGDKKKLLATAESLSKNPAYNSGDLGRRIATIKQEYQFVEASEIEKGGQFLKAAQRFEAIAIGSPQSQDADKAWFNAGVNYRKAGQIDKAIACFTKVFQNYPKSPQAPEALVLIIEMTADRLQLDVAAQHSSLFLSRFPKDKRHDVVARETCFLYDATNNVSQAAQVCQGVMNSRSPQSKVTAETLLNLYERNGRYRDVVTIVDGYLLKQGAPESQKIIWLAKAADAERKLGKGGAATARDQQISRIFAANGKSVQGEALAHVGRIEFQKQLPVMQKFQSTRLRALKADGSDLMQSIQAKNGLLQNVEVSFKKVIATGDAEWGVAALHVIGTAYEMMAADLRNPPTPPGASPEAVKKVRDGLQNFANGFSEKSRVFYQDTAATVTKFGVYNDYSKRNAEALSRVALKDRRKLEEWIPQATFVGSRWMEVGKVTEALEQLGGAR